MEIIIEELSKGHKLISRQKYNNGSVKIGRAYTNDVIVSDPHVCPEHLSVNYNGEDWVVEDDNSLNGSFLGQSKQTAHGHIVKSGDVIALGNSQIRLLFPQHPVSESVPFSAFETLINLARNPLVIGLSILLFTLASGWLTYLDKGKEVNFTQLLVPAIGMALVFSIWPALVSLVSHLTKNDARVMHQIGTCFVFFLLLMLTDIVQALVSFNTSSNWPIAWLTYALPIGVAFTLFWLNCYIGFHMSERRRMAAAATLTLIFFGGGALVHFSRQPEFNPRPQYDATIMPPSYLYSSSSDVDGFLDDAEKLFEKTRQQSLTEK